MSITSLKNQYKYLSLLIKNNKTEMEQLLKLDSVKSYINSDSKYFKTPNRMYIDIYKRLDSNNQILNYQRRKTLCSIVLYKYFIKNLNYDPNEIDCIFDDIINENPLISDKALVLEFNKRIQSTLYKKR